MQSPEPVGVYEQTNGEIGYGKGDGGRTFEVKMRAVPTEKARMSGEQATRANTA